MRLFLALLVTVYLGISAYGGSRWASLLPPGTGRYLAVIFAFSMTLAFPIGMAASKSLPEAARYILVQSGEIWMGALPGLVIPAFIWDIYRVFSYLAGKGWSSGTHPWMFLAWTIGSILLLTVGIINAGHPVIKNIDVKIPRLSGPPIKAVLMTDLHVDSETSTKWLRKIAEEVREISPDVIFLAGDVLDGSDGPALERAARGLSELKAPMGTYACPGNHEYYLGIRRAQVIMEDNGITVLRDRRTLVDGRLWVLGREDVQSIRSGLGRSQLTKIMPQDGLPTIVLDHTPSSINEATEAGASLVLSGHTHHGQIFPFQIVTSALFDLDWGLKRYGKTVVYVSCGVGVWGPPVRTSSRPEIVVLKLSRFSPP